MFNSKSKKFISISYRFSVKSSISHNYTTWVKRRASQMM